MICNGRKQLFKPLLLSLEGPAQFSAVAEAVCSVPVSEFPLSSWGEDGQSQRWGPSRWVLLPAREVMPVPETQPCPALGCSWHETVWESEQEWSRLRRAGCSLEVVPWQSRPGRAVLGVRGTSSRDAQHHLPSSSIPSPVQPPPSSWSC